MFHRIPGALSSLAGCHDGMAAERTFLATPIQLKFMRRWLSTFLSVCRVRERCIQDVISASGEALANSIEHGYHGAKERVQMKCYCCRTHGAVLVEVEDYGEGQQPPRHSQKGDRGFGFAIMRGLAEDVRVRSDRGTVVTLKFRPELAR